MTGHLYYNVCVQEARGLHTTTPTKVTSSLTPFSLSISINFQIKFGTFSVSSDGKIWDCSWMKTHLTVMVRVITQSLLVAKSCCLKSHYIHSLHQRTTFYVCEKAFNCKMISQWPFLKKYVTITANKMNLGILQRSSQVLFNPHNRSENWFCIK